MNHEIAIELTNADNRIRTLRDLNAQFLRHLSAHSEPERTPSSLAVQDETISVDCFGHTVVANPRIVRLEDSTFATEYIFVAYVEELGHELWRFYLTGNARLLALLEDDDSYICDFNNRFIADHICTPILRAGLRSVLFAPKELPGG